MEDDCYLPHFRRQVSTLCRNAHLAGDGEGAERLRDGVDRDRPGEEHAWSGEIGGRITYTFAAPCRIRRIRLVFDSDLNRRTLPYPENSMNRNMFHNRQQSFVPSRMPATMLKRYRITACGLDGSMRAVLEEKNN